MKKIGFPALLTVILLLLSGCRGADIDVSADVTEGPKITIETFETPSDAPEAVPDNTLPTEKTEPPISESSPAETSEEAMHDDFALPEEFYAEMDGIVEKYSLNPGCDGSESCACRPEYEENGVRANVVSVYFKDIDSGTEYVLNGGAHYPIASTIKIPFCTLIYRKMDEGLIDSEQVLTYEERHYFEGSGVIIEGDFGQEYTVRELLKLAITRSDNIAYEMLKDLVSWDEFSAYLAENGCTHEEDLRRSKQKICCESAGAYGRILAEYLRSDGEHVGEFKEDLLNTRIPLIVSDYPVYRKYGWAGFSFHDIAYVDAPHPYILAILTNFTGEGASDAKLFREITALVEKYGQGERD